MSTGTCQPLTATIDLPRAAAFVDWLVAHWRDEGIAVEHTAEHVRLALADVGVVELAISTTRCITCRLQPATVRMGELMQLSLTEHLAEFADEMRWPEDSWELVWSGQTPRSRAQLQVLQVHSNRALTPHMRRLRLQGPGVQALADGGLHVRMLLPQGDAAPAWPTVLGDGRMRWQGGKPRLPRRTYTIRAIDFDASWIDIDVLLHPAGEAESPGARWAAQAQPGSEVGVLSPAGGLLLRAERLVMVADACAMPAAARMAQAAQGKAMALLLWVADAAERAAFDVPPALVQPDWLCTGVPGASAPELAQVLQWLDTQHWHDGSSDTVLWVAGGLRLTQAVRHWAAAQPTLRGVRTLIHTYWR